MENEVTKKKCKACLEEKELCEFGKNNAKKDKLNIYCRECENKRAYILRQKTKDIPLNKKCNICNEVKSCDEFHKGSSSVDGLQYKCKSCVKIEQSAFYFLNKSKISLFKKEKRIEEKIKNPDKLREKDKKDREGRKKYSKKYSKTYFKNRRLKDPIFKLIGNLRTRIKTSFIRKNHNQNSKTKDVLGCSWEYFKEHIESQFENWMTWENYGNCEVNDYNCAWHLDHIIPVSYAKTEDDVYLLNHWSNFQPLCSYKNTSKNKYMGDVSNIELKLQLINGQIKFS